MASSCSTLAVATYRSYRCRTYWYMVSGMSPRISSTRQPLDGSCSGTLNAYLRSPEAAAILPRIARVEGLRKSSGAVYGEPAHPGAPLARSAPQGEEIG